MTNETFEVVAGRLDVGAEHVEEAEELLSDLERERARRFVFDGDRDRFIIARAGLRRLLGTRMRMRPEMVEFLCGPQGKPTLANKSWNERLSFNLSHTDDVVVYAISCGCEIGIDVEAVRAIPDIDKVAAHCFSAQEIATYQRLQRQDKLRAFFNGWTRKEAFVKAIGEGLGYPLDSFDVSLAPAEEARLLRVGGDSGAQCGWKLCSFEPFPGYVGAVVVKNSTPKVDYIQDTKMYRSQLND